MVAVRGAGPASRRPPGAPAPRRHRRALIVALVAAASLAPAACGPGRPLQPRTAASAPAAVRNGLLRQAAGELCATESAQEMGVERLGRLYDARPDRYLTVQRAESTARRKLRDGLAALAATGVDRSTLGTLVADEDAVLAARAHLLEVLGGQPANRGLALLTGPRKIVDGYRAVVDAYQAAGRDFLAAGLAACATPLITVLVGPGQDEASAATVEFRIAAACRTVGYTTRSERPAQTTAYTAPRGTVVQPGTHKRDDRYDGASGPVTPPATGDELVVLTSVHFPVDSATCAPAPATN